MQREVIVCRPGAEFISLRAPNACQMNAQPSKLFGQSRDHHQNGRHADSNGRMLDSDTSAFLLASSIPVSARREPIKYATERLERAISSLEDMMQRIVYMRVLPKQISFAPIEQHDRANSSEIRPEGTPKRSLSFVEDFMLEHSVSGTRSTPVEILGRF